MEENFINIKLLEQLNDYPELRDLLLEKYKDFEGFILEENESLTLDDQDITLDGIIEMLKEDAIFEYDEDNSDIYRIYTQRYQDYTIKVYTVADKEFGEYGEEQYEGFSFYKGELPEIIELTNAQKENRNKWEDKRDSSTKKEFLDFLMNIPFP